MAIGSVMELVDFKQKSIEIAKKYGGDTTEIELEIAQLSASVLSLGGKVDDVDDRVDDVEDSIADAYNPNKTTGYSIGDLVIYEDKLYRCSSPVSVGAGEFDSTKWDAIPDYDSTQTYNEYDYVVYDGVPYRCDEANTTGEWDSSKWTDVSNEFGEYSETAIYYQGSRVSYDGGYYKANATYSNAGTVGEFNPSKWTATTIETMLEGVKVKTATVSLNGLTTDENGLIALSSITNRPSGTIINTLASPYGGFAPAGTTGFCYTLVNPNYILVESLTAGVRSPITSEELGGIHFIKFIYI